MRLAVVRVADDTKLHTLSSNRNLMPSYSLFWCIRKSIILIFPNVGGRRTVNWRLCVVFHSVKSPTSRSTLPILNSNKNKRIYQGINISARQWPWWPDVGGRRCADLCCRSSVSRACPTICTGIVALSCVGIWSAVPSGWRHLHWNKHATLKDTISILSKQNVPPLITKRQILHSCSE